MTATPESTVRLVMKEGRVCLDRGDGEEAAPVRAKWALPISGGADGPVSLLGEDKKELLFLHDPSVLDAESRQMLEFALSESYLLPVIVRVLDAVPHFGNRYWKVETDRGLTDFVLRDPNRNVTNLTDDHMIIRDTMGNRFEIRSLAALDQRSRTLVDRVL